MYIDINNLYKRFGKVEILKGITFYWKRKTKYIIKGENGIGKSTLFKSILNQIKYDGIIEVSGRISYAPEIPPFPPYMSAYTFIKTISQLSDTIENFENKLDKYLELFNIKGKKKSQLGSLSKGQKQKINLIASLLTPSEILLLDEPFSGLDDDSKIKLLDVLNSDERLLIIISHEIEYFDFI